MAKAGTAAAAAKTPRPKTGGRVKKPLGQLLEEADARDHMARYDDDTAVPPALAAIYLGISDDTLAELRKPRAPGESGTEGPPFYKVAVPGAKGSNQTPMYSMKGLREYKKKHQGTSSHEVAVKANMLGWVSAQEPFFTQPEARRQPTTLIARAWDFEDPERDDFFIRAARGEIRVVWMPPAEAVCSRWQSSARHKALMDAWIELLQAEEGAARAALERTEFHEVAREAPANGH